MDGRTSFTQPAFGYELPPEPPLPTPPFSASSTGPYNFQFHVPRAAQKHALLKLLKQNHQGDDDETGDYNPDHENLQYRRRRKRNAERAAKRAQEKAARENEHSHNRDRSRSPDGLFTDDTTLESGPEDFDRGGHKKHRHSSYQRSLRHHSHHDPLASESDVEFISASTTISPTPDPDPSRWGRWGRPVHFSFKRSSHPRRECQFHSHPMYGHPAPESDIGRKANYMCFDCTIARVVIGFCPHGAFRKTNEGVNHRRVIKRLNKGKHPKASLCAICSTCADFECRDKVYCEQGVREEAGCGLVLCDVCFGKLGSEFKGDLDRMLAEGRFEDDEYPVGVRADMEFLNMKEGALARQAVDQGVF